MHITRLFFLESQKPLSVSHREQIRETVRQGPGTEEELKKQKEAAAQILHSYVLGRHHRNGGIQKYYVMNPLRYRKQPEISLEQDMAHWFNIEKDTPDPEEIRKKAKEMRVDLLKQAHPLFYLSTARKCNEIKNGVIRFDQDPRFQEEAMLIRDEIKKGNWDIVSHLYFKEKFKQDAPLHHAYPQDALFYLYWKGHLCRAEFQTAMTKLNIDEQIKGSIDPEYHSKNRTTEKTRLPKLPGTVETCRIFKSSDSQELTPEAENHFQRMKESFDKGKPGEFPKGFDRDTLIKELKKIPEHLQVFFLVADIKSSDITRSSGLEFWFRDIYRQTPTPFLGLHGSGGLTASRWATDALTDNGLIDPSRRQNFFENNSLHFPSYGVLYALFLTQTQVRNSLAHRAVCHPVMCLNSMDEESVMDMHREIPAQVISICDPRAKGSFPLPHGKKAGPVISEMGHEVSHAFLVTKLAPTTKNIANTILPSQINKIAATEEEKEIAQRLNAFLTDLDFPLESKEFKLEDIIKNFLFTYLQNHVEKLRDPDAKVRKAARSSLDNELKFYKKLRKELIKKDSLPRPYGSKDNGDRFFSKNMHSLQHRIWLIKVLEMAIRVFPK